VKEARRKMIRAISEQIVPRCELFMMQNEEEEEEEEGNPMEDEEKMFYSKG